MDTLNIRKDFPYLDSQINGRPPVYFDSAATTHKPVQVINTISEIYSKYNAPVNRSAYSSGGTATELYLKAHENIARFIGAPSYRGIVLTKNATEAINLLAYALVQSRESGINLSSGDEIIIPLSEHHSNYIPWMRMAETSGVVIKNLQLNADGLIDLPALKSLITDKTKLICCAHVSNVLGIINPVKEMAITAKDAGALFLVDGNQSVPHMPVNVQDIGCDFFVFSGHKMLGPAGTGVLWGRESLLEKLPPFIYGGGMVKSVKGLSVEWNDLPWKFEAGTPDMCGAVALAGAENILKGIKLTGAMDYLSRIGMQNVLKYEQHLSSYALEKLADVEGVKVYGPRTHENRSGIISFNVYKDGEMTDAHIISEFLSSCGIEARAGGHCAYPLMNEMKISGTLRISFYIYNTIDEIDYFIDSLIDIIENRLL
ncbi:MAG: cysteine desulfurase [Spirochaetae bacterium HGW-Spirochaetae-5]|nr:MAG: cysteine desulfurase [Spirochaetae bacterium HGW-Spirochaetae-5]